MLTDSARAALVLALSVQTLSAQTDPVRTPVPADDVLIAEPSARGVLTGRLMGPDGAVSGRIAWGEGDAELIAEADESGRFRFDAVPERSGVGLPLVVRADGFRTRFARHVEARALGHRDLGDLELIPGELLRGRVVDSHGSPVADARVEVFVDQRRFRQAIPTHITITNPAGEWIVRGVMPAAHVVRVTPPAPFAVTLQRNAHPDGDPMRTTVLRGQDLRVTLRDWNDQPVVGAQVIAQARFAHELVRQTRTSDDGGQLIFRGLPTNGLELESVPPTGTPWSHWQRIPEGTTAVELRPPYGLLKVQPIDSDSGEPIPYAFVGIESRLPFHRHPLPMPFEWPYRIEKDQRLRIEAPDHEVVSVADLETPASGVRVVEIALQRRTSMENSLSLPANHGIRGVVQRSRHPVQNARVRLGRFSAITGVDGGFHLEVPRGVTGRLEVDGGAHGSRTGLDVEAPARLVVLLGDWSPGTIEWAELTPATSSVPRDSFRQLGSSMVPDTQRITSGSISGTVNIDGRPAVGRVIELHERAETYWDQVGAAITDERGRYRITPRALEDGRGEGRLIVAARPHDWGRDFDQRNGVAGVTLATPRNHSVRHDFNLVVATVTLHLEDDGGRLVDFDPQVFSLDEDRGSVRPRGRIRLCGMSSSFDEHQDYPLRLARGRYRVHFWTRQQGHVIRDFEVVDARPITVSGIVQPPRTVELLLSEETRYVSLTDDAGHRLAHHYIQYPAGSAAQPDGDHHVARFPRVQPGRYRFRLHGPETSSWSRDSGPVLGEGVFEVTADSPPVVVVDRRHR